MIADIIKSDTKSSHQALEKVIIQKIKAIHRSADYNHLLALFYGFFKPVEERIATFLPSDNFPSLTGRRKSGWLLADMQLIGDENAQLKTSSWLPEIETAGAALGALYVLEGSTLGGVHIARMIASQTPISADRFRFFQGYGKDTATQWAGFLKEMETFATNNPQEQEMLIATAQDTFRQFERWALAFEQ